MKILFATSEALPFAMSGGLADVSGALPKALRKRLVGCRVVMPLYSTIKPELREKMTFVGSITVPVSWRRQYCGIFEAHMDGVIYYLIDNQYYFKRDMLYGHYDDAERFAFFSRAVLEMIPYIDFKPDVINCNDWQTALSVIYLRCNYGHIQEYQKIRTVYSIHNLKFQGIFPKQILSELLNLEDDYFAEDKLKFYDCISFMKGGIIYSDFVNTVSPTYAEEIQNDYFGEGLDGVLRQYNYKLKGILNGIDFELYDPKTDVSIFENYSSMKPEGKAENKLMLQKELGLKEDKTVPMIGIISRLTPQKGFDLVIAMIEEILSTGAQLVILGTGDDKYQDVFSYYASKYPSRVSCNIRFSDALARKIYAASDIFLMPSMFEPCGLGQIMALRYGSIPVVRETGGLKDTITPFDEYKGKGNGFSFTNFNAHDMMYVIRYALSVYENKEAWTKLVRRAMKNKFDWTASAQNYIEMYNNL